MWNGSETYLDYVDVRRRVERRLASGMSLVIHCGLFMLGLVALIAIWGRPFGLGGAPLLNLGMAGWSGILLLHSLWTLRQTGSSTTRRLEAVRAEVEERLESGDTTLLTNPRQAFRVESLLDEDVRMRAGWVPALVFAAVMNCFLWGATLIGGPSSSAMWHVVLLLSVVYLPATYGINRARRMMRDNKLRQMMATRTSRGPVARDKQKRSFDAELERYARLTDDGELVDMPDDWAAYDAERKRG